MIPAIVTNDPLWLTPLTCSQLTTGAIDCFNETGQCPSKANCTYANDWKGNVRLEKITPIVVVRPVTIQHD
ncbi:hypothetical protein VUR80DRAFT_10250 [Thermomyces stellatus]